jgi:hypothetical protein
MGVWVSESRKGEGGGGGRWCDHHENRSASLVDAAEGPPSETLARPFSQSPVWLSPSRSRFSTRRWASSRSLALRRGEASGRAFTARFSSRSARCEAEGEVEGETADAACGPGIVVEVDGSAEGLLEGMSIAGRSRVGQ